MKISMKRTFTELNRGYGDGLSRVKLKTFKDHIRLLRLKLIYGHELSLICVIIANGTYISDLFMQNYVNDVIEQKESQKLIKSLNYNRFNIFNKYKYRLIYFDQGYIGRDDVINSQLFKKRMKTIFKVIKKYFNNDEIGIKYHPGDNSAKNWHNVGMEIDRSIPAEYLYNKRVNIYLSFSSGSIGNIGKYKNEKGVVVSLVDYIFNKNEARRTKTKKAILDKSYSKIMFPKSIQEFEKIVVNTLANRN